MWYCDLHVKRERNLSVLVADNWELDIVPGNLSDILDPSSVRLDCVCGETDQFGATLGELWLELRKGTKLGGADWSVIFWVGEEDYPVVADEIVEVDGAIGGFGVEVWSDGAQTDSAEGTIS
jgi:hypothetical protein